MLEFRLGYGFILCAALVASSYFVVVSVSLMLVCSFVRPFHLDLAFPSSTSSPSMVGDLPSFISISSECSAAGSFCLISVCCRCWCPVGVPPLRCRLFRVWTSSSVVRHEFSFWTACIWQDTVLGFGCWHNCCRIGRNRVCLYFALRSKACELFSTGIFIHDAVAPVFFILRIFKTIFLLNSGLVVLVACLCTDAFVWPLAYEISLISICTAFSLEGRSVSKELLLSESCWYCR